MSLFSKILDAKPLAPKIPPLLPLGEWLLLVRSSSLKRTMRGDRESLGAVVLFAVLSGPTTEREHGWGWWRIGEGPAPEVVLSQLKQYLVAHEVDVDTIGGEEWQFSDLLDRLRGNLVRCSITTKPLKHDPARQLMVAKWSSASDLSAAQVGELLDHRALQLPEHESELASRMLTLGKALGTCEGSPREHEVGSRILDLFADLPETSPGCATIAKY